MDGKRARKPQNDHDHSHHAYNEKRVCGGFVILRLGSAVLIGCCHCRLLFFFRFLFPCLFLLLQGENGGQLICLCRILCVHGKLVHILFLIMGNLCALDPAERQKRCQFLHLLAGAEGHGYKPRFLLHKLAAAITAYFHARLILVLTFWTPWHTQSLQKFCLYLLRRYSSIPFAPAFPAPIARITVAAPVTASPPA